nr:hypothetical protein [Tanacetum cinerariifolium]
MNKKKEEYWVTSALTNDNIVADFLVRMKQLQPPSSSSQQPSTSKTTTTIWLTPIRWGHRKSRSKPPPTIVNNNTATIKQHQQSGSPTTPLCWSGGAGTSTDGYDESSRSGDHRSNKGALGNEGTTTSGYKKSKKRKSFAELKEEEDFLLKERQQLNRELESMRVTMSTQIATSQNLKKFKMDLHQKPKEEMIRMTNMVNSQIHTSSMVEAETEAHKTGFVLPDLNMTPDAEAL